jgi:hypothetical protein
MLFPQFRRHGRISAAQRMIIEHSRWLTRMLSLEFWEKLRGGGMPRIPVRKVSEGGFARLMSTPAGRYRAERWWERTLEQLDD